MLETVITKWRTTARSGAFALLFVLFFVALPAHAQIDQGGLADTAGLDDPAITENVNLPTQTPLVLFIARAINVTLSFIGIIMLGLIMYGGWLYMTSGGNPEQIEQAKKIWKNAVIGLVIVLSSFAIVNFILRALFNDGGGGPGSPTRPVIDPGVGSLGDGLIESHYPQRNQRDVPRNVSVIITFKEAIDPATVCNDESGGGDADDESDGACTGEALQTGSLAIFTAAAGDTLYDGADDEVQGRAVDATVHSSSDRRTFVITPQGYLGNSSSEQWYGVRVFGDALDKANGEAVKLNFSGDNRYQWVFEVSTKLDLTPPQVESVFPHPDNERDGESTVQGAKAASGRITIQASPETGRTAAPSGYTCSYDGAVTYQRAAGTSGELDTVTISNANPPLPNGSGLVQQASVVDNQASIGCGLVIDMADVTTGETKMITLRPAIAPDTVTVANARFTFGNDIDVEEDNEKTADNLATAIKNRVSTVEAEANSNVVTVIAVAAGTAGNSIRLAADSDNNAVTVSGETLTGGTDQQTVAEIKSRPDEPRNAVVQINFNEAINPLTVSGPTHGADGNVLPVGDVLQVRCFTENGDNCNARDDDKYQCRGYTCLKGEFAISNVYRTVEFRTTTKCGQNSCGEDRYCLPPNVRVAVHVKAAPLQPCGDFDSNNACTGPAGGNGIFEQCRADSNDPVNACYNADTAGDTQYQNKHYPTVASSDWDQGVVDVAFNSLDGNKNEDAQGPGSPGVPADRLKAFFENDLVGVCEDSAEAGTLCTDANREVCTGGSAYCARNNTFSSLFKWSGTNKVIPTQTAVQDATFDNYLWSFWVSDKIFTDGPVLTEMEMKANKSLVGEVGEQVAGVATDQPVRATFNRLMRAATLKPGYNYPDDFYPGTDNTKHREYLAFVNFGARPLGYWVKKEDSDSDGDTYNDQTTAIINHTPLAESAAYGFVAGSGLNDVYQNCYNPGEDDGIGDSECQGLEIGQSCCKGDVLDDTEAVCYGF